MKIDEKRNVMLEIERHDEEWWSVHVTPISGEGDDKIVATCSAGDVQDALHAAAHTVNRVVVDG
jgi:hypothetical protein